MKVIVLVLIGLVLNVYALTTMVSTIIWEQPILTPNCGKATKFALFGYTAPLTGEYVFDTKLTTDCQDTVLIFGADKSCNNDISSSNLKSELKVSLVAGILYQFYVGGYKDSCAKGTSVSLSYEFMPPTKNPTSNPTVPPVSRVPYKIKIQFSSSIEDKYKPAFINAAARWQQIITRDLPLVISVKNVQIKNCFGFDPKYSGFRTRIDDILIGANVGPTDKPILGSAGVCVVDETEFPRLAVMDFNSAVVDLLMNQGSWENVIMHEMGHALGVGGSWAERGLIAKPTTVRYCVLCYLGKNGNYANRLIGRPAEEKAIIEDVGRPGTVGAHWKEDIYDTELMTGYGGGYPAEVLSALTVYSLIDIGYTVDVSKAEPFTVPSGRRLRVEKNRKFDWEATVVRPKVELVYGFPKPGREKEVEDLIMSKMLDKLNT